MSDEKELPGEMGMWSMEGCHDQFWYVTKDGFVQWLRVGPMGITVDAWDRRGPSPSGNWQRLDPAALAAKPDAVSRSCLECERLAGEVERLKESEYAARSLIWTCGCGWNNGVNLAECAMCSRTVSEACATMYDSSVSRAEAAERDKAKLVELLTWLRGWHATAETQASAIVFKAEHAAFVKEIDATLAAAQPQE